MEIKAGRDRDAGTAGSKSVNDDGSLIVTVMVIYLCWEYTRGRSRRGASPLATCCHNTFFLQPERVLGTTKNYECHDLQPFYH